jgi:hypothetical protein
MRNPTFAISSAELEALTGALEGVFDALEQMRKTLAELDALPPAESVREREIRDWMKAELMKTQLEMLMPPITICGVLKKINPNQIIHWLPDPHALGVLFFASRVNHVPLFHVSSAFACVASLVRANH